MINTVIYSDTVTNLRLSPNVSSSRNRLFAAGSFSFLSVVGSFKRMKSLRPILGMGAETCENQATFNYLLNKGVETEEFRMQTVIKAINPKYLYTFLKEVFILGSTYLAILLRKNK